MGQDRPNLLLIMCDELRFDALGCYGNPVIKTPNIDRLAAEGVLLEHYFSQSPVCQPSRATLATGRYPHVHGVRWNWYDLDAREVTLQTLLSQSEYSTWAVGKMHFEPTTESHGFQNRVFVEGKLFTGDDEYRQHLSRIGKRQLYYQHVKRWNNDDDFGAAVSPLSDDDYIDTYIGQNAVRVLSQVTAPFFVWVSFVNPHFPFDPPQPFATMYDPKMMPLPQDFHFNQTSRIPEQRVASASRSFHQLTEDHMRKIIAYYYGTISLVDREVGRIMDSLKDRGLLDETVIVFASDHGDLLGHRGMLWKGRMLYDHLIRVPMIVRYPKELASGKVVSHLCQVTDVMPTFLDFAGIVIPTGVQGRSLRSILKQEAVPWRDAVFSEVMDLKMVRDFHWKLIFYPGRSYGELYHIAVDPLELNNLYDHPDYERRRSALIEKLANLLIQTEDPLPLAHLRSGYAEISGVHSTFELGPIG
ncbi:MAG TPA: sulfatase-like hydrolase/transferase [bacterium]|nr:sulfatase-like hydrolase/transferase [bacterium]